MGTWHQGAGSQQGTRDPTHGIPRVISGDHRAGWDIAGMPWGHNATASPLVPRRGQYLLQGVHPEQGVDADQCPLVLAQAGHVAGDVHARGIVTVLRDTVGVGGPPPQGTLPALCPPWAAGPQGHPRDAAPTLAPPALHPSQPACPQGHPLTTRTRSPSPAPGGGSASRRSRCWVRFPGAAAVGRGISSWKGTQG